MQKEKKNSLVIPKVLEYFSIKAGSEIKLSEIYEKFIEKNKKDKHKKKKHKAKHSKEEKNYELEVLLDLLEKEGLIQVNKKTISISKPFRLYGKISISKRGDGFVNLPSKNEVFIPVEKTEGSITGDTVEILPTRIGKKGRLEGEVLSIVQRGRLLYRLKVTEIDGNYIYGKLLDISGEYKEGVIRKKTLLQDVIHSIRVNDILIVKLKENSLFANNIYEVSFLKFEIGTTRDIDLNRILMKYNYQQSYPDHISLEFNEEVSQNTVPDWDKRVDLRGLYTVTIDGENAKDFDDAISIEEVDGVVKFYVHIADVSHYVKQGSSLDEEAYKRATSVYLVDCVVPMLPPILSENLCSLVAGKNRLAFTVEMTGDYNGRIFSAKFYKSVIIVDRRLTYEIAQEEIDKNDWNNPLVKLMKLANGLKEARIKQGRVELDLKEMYIKTTQTGEVIEIKERERLNSHILIEELMLSANTKVAEFLRKKKAPTLYRIHEPMDEEKLESLNIFLQLYGINHVIPSSDYEDIREALQKISGNPSERVFHYFLLRSFMQAYYGGEILGHWGLGFKDYCHFTSPIRRYSDLVVHRVLDAVIQGDSLPYTEKEIAQMGIHTSEQERRAVDAERDIQKLKACRYLAQTGIQEFMGVITGIKPQMVFVEIEGFNVEGVISHEHFTDGFELIIKNEFSFISKRFSKTFFIGQKLNLLLEKIDLDEIRIFVKPKV